MAAGMAFLVAGYVFSQFYRAFLAVLSPVLLTEIGATPGDLAVSSGLMFLSFAAMQLPIGSAFDRIGPRRTTALLLGLGAAGGALVFAQAQGPMAVHLAMFLIGIGCAPVLMAAYYIFARTFSPAVFGTLAGAIIGVGSLGNIAGAAPLAWLIGAIGWRETLVALAALTVAVALGIWFLVRDPGRVDAEDGGSGSIGDVLRIRALWPILPLMAVAYAPPAALRGLWIGPYLADVFGADANGIGTATLVMGLAMVAGNFAYGPLDRMIGSRKWGVLAGNTIAAACLSALVLLPQGGIVGAVALMALVGFFGASFPAIMTHGQSFVPPHLIGRGVTFLNMFGIGGAGLLQFASGRVHASADTATGTAAEPYAAVFQFFLVPLILGLGIYLFSRDSRA